MIRNKWRERQLVEVHLLKRAFAVMLSVKSWITGHAEE